jgi:RNA polymerase sigma factor (sigma-70 family)
MFFKKRLNEKQLIEGLKNGNEEALYQLYRDNYTSVRNHIMRNSGKSEDVEDVLQEAVVVVWENIRKNDFELNSKISTYLFAIVKRMWLKKLNKNSRMDYNSEKVEANGSVYEQDFSNEKLKIAQELLNELDKVCKELLTLFYFKDLENKEIAEIMGFANTDVVKSKRYQCFKKLQQNAIAKYHKTDFLN